MIVLAPSVVFFPSSDKATLKAYFYIRLCDQYRDLKSTERLHESNLVNFVDEADFLTDFFSKCRDIFYIYKLELGQKVTRCHLFSLF